MFDNGGSAFSVADGVAMVAQGLEVLANIDAADLPGAGVGEVVVELGAQLRQLEATQARLADRFCVSGAWGVDGARSGQAWITGRVNDSRGGVARMTRLGIMQRKYRVMGAAFRDGVVSAGHLQVLAKAHQRFPRLGIMLTQAEEHIVELARVADPRRFERDLLALCHRVDPDAVDADDHDRRHDYYLRASTTLHGAVLVDGLLPPEVGALFLNALEAARRDVTTPDATTPAPAPTPESEGEAWVAVSQRNVDALQRLVTAAVAARDEAGSYVLPQVNGARPVLSVTIALDSLLADSQHHAMGVLERFGVPHAALTAASAQRLACDGVISPLMINAEGQIIATLPNVRAVPAHIRKAVISRDTHCRFPHCAQRIDEVHHIIYASHGGHTTMINLAGLCYYHHRLIHHGDWTIHGDANTQLTFHQRFHHKHWTTHPPPRRT